MFLYRYPDRDQYPEDFQRFSHIRLGEYLAEAATGASNFMVYEAPGIEDPSTSIQRITIWEPPKEDLETPETKAAAEMGEKLSVKHPLVCFKGPIHPRLTAFSSKLAAEDLKRRDANPARLAA